MGEVYNLVINDSLSFNGYFNLDELISFIDGLFSDRGYDKSVNREILDQENNSIEKNLMFDKKFSDYARGVVIVRIVAKKEKEEVVMVGKEKKKMDKGSINITFKIVQLETDFEKKWEKNPLSYVYRWFVDKFIVKKYIDAYKDTLLADYNEVKKEIKAFLGIDNYV